LIDGIGLAALRDSEASISASGFTSLSKEGDWPSGNFRPIDDAY
jgi:hypothetical protein